jgi:DNA-binding response OmpR family regulator
MMPDLNGDEVLKLIKSDPDKRDIPVIMISADTDAEKVSQCIEFGADDYLSKPFNPAILRARIGAALRTKEGRVLEAFFVNRPLDDVSHLQATKTNQPREEAIK